jgi:hypothetical protein
VLGQQNSCGQPASNHPMRFSRQLNALNATDSNTGQDTVVVDLPAVIPVMNSLYCYYFTYLYI